jgi:LacI family transcriptional regulator
MSGALPLGFSFGLDMAGKTIVDIARAAGVSFKTVSRVINREPTVRKETREHVEAVIARLDYQPNVWARALRSSRSHLIGLMCRSAKPSYINQVQLAAMSTFQHEGFHLVLEELGRSSQGLGKRVSELVRSIQLDGVILVPPLADNIEVLRALESARIPFVRLSPYEHLDREPYIQVDDYKAAHDMTRYLRSLGHVDIGFVKGPATHGAAGQRLQGFRDAMRELGGNLREEWVVAGNFNVRSGMEAGDALLSRGKRPSAIFASNDETANGVISAAYRAGLVLPRDLSIVGFDDSPIASSLWPRLTTVHQPLAQMAREAAAMLMEQIRSPGDARSKKIALKIVVRDSAAAVEGRANAPSKRARP